MSALKGFHFIYFLSICYITIQFYNNLFYDKLTEGMSGILLCIPAIYAPGLDVVE